MIHGNEVRSPDSVLANAAWLRSFTAKLVHDADLAEDLGQEVVLAGLSNPPPTGVPSRPWLARVARNIAIGFVRRETRRLRAEEAAPRAGTAPGTADVVAEAEIQFAAGQSLLGLPEPYRSALLSRFMRGLSCREIAKQSGVPVETVRTRIKRGLALLRSKMDREYGGRRAWLPPIAVIDVWQISTPSLWGIVLMKVKTKVLLAVSLLLVSLLGVWYVASPPASRLAALPRDTEGSMVAEGPEPEVVANVNERTALDSEASPSAEAQVASLLVRVTWQDTGKPAAHVGVSVTELLSTNTRHSPASAPANLAATGAEGTVLFEDLDPGRFDVQTHRQDEDVVELLAGEARTVEFEIPPGLRVRGVVVDRDGLPVAGAEVLCLISVSPPQSSYPLTMTAGDGSFTVESPSRSNLIGARAQDYGTSDFAHLQDFVPDSGGDVVIRLVLPGSPATITGRVFDPLGHPVASAWVTIGGKGSRQRRRLLPGGGAIHAPPTVHVTTDDRGSFLVTSLRPGPNPVFVYARGYSRWRGTVECPTGTPTHVTIQLQHGASLFGQIRDRYGKPVQDATLIRPANCTETGFAQTDADGRYRFDDLPGGEISLSIHSPKLGSMRPTLLVTTGMEHRVDFTLDAGLQIRGVLVDHLGKPLEGWVLEEKGGFRDFARADSEGVFVLNSCERRMYTLAVYQPRFVGPAVLTLEHVLPSVEARTIRVPLEALPSARILGRVHMPDGTPATGVELHFRHHHYPMDPVPKTDTEGRFAIGPLPPGVYELIGSRSGYLGAKFGEIVLLADEVRKLPDACLGYGARLSVTILPSAPEQSDGLEVAVVDEQDHPIQKGSRQGASVGFGLLPPGSFKLSVRGPNTETQRLPIALRAQETLVLEINLR